MEKEKIYTLEELIKKLTPKENIFCHEYIIDWNGARAARAAGYSENTAKQIASENLTKPYIKQYIDFIKNDLEKEAGISKLRNLKELGKMAYSSIANLHNTWIELKDFEALEEEQLAAIESTETKVFKKDIGGKGEIEIVDVEYIKLKLYSKLTAITEINKMLGYNEPEKVKHSGEINTAPKIDYSKLSDEAKKEIMEASGLKYESD